VADARQANNSTKKNASAKFQDRHCECLYSLASMLAERLYRLECVPDQTFHMKTWAPARAWPSPVPTSVFGQRLVVGLDAAAVPWVSALGFTQQPCTRLLRVSGAFGSKLPWRTRQRNVAWICPAGQPNRS
jgi:hypothetical protein